MSDQPNGNLPDDTQLPGIDSLSKPDVFIVVDEKGKKHFHVRVKSNDTILELRRIPLLRYQMWLVTYQTTMPMPPVIELRIGGKTRPGHDPSDPHYQLRLEAWNQAFEVEQQAYFFKHGIADNPPDDFEFDYVAFGLDENSTEDRRFAWVSGLLETQEDITDVLQAIMQLLMPDEQSIWEAQAQQFKSVGEWQARTRVFAESAT